MTLSRVLLSVNVRVYRPLVMYSTGKFEVTPSFSLSKSIAGLVAFNKLYLERISNDL